MDGGLPSRVKSVRFENISEKVYNFEVEGNHNYFVSEDGILSHNGSRPPASWWRDRMGDSKLPKHIRGWIKNELRQGRTFSTMRNPPGCDVGHHPTNRGPHDDRSRFEASRDNRSRPGRTGNDPKWR